MTQTSPDHGSTPYRAPDRFTRLVLNPLMGGVTRLGISVCGSRVLEHRGRRTGRRYRTPVNLLVHEGTSYLVAPRGETQWVRNVRHDGGRVVLILGRHRRRLQARELPAEDRVPVLRAYLRRWAFEAGAFFDGVTADATDAEFASVAAEHPVFALVDV